MCMVKYAVYLGYAIVMHSKNHLLWIPLAVDYAKIEVYNVFDARHFRIGL